MTVAENAVVRRQVVVDAPIDHAFSLIERRTRALARRQRMWFRRDPRITWVGAAEKPAVLGGALLQAWRA